MHHCVIQPFSTIDALNKIPNFLHTLQTLPTQYTPDTNRRNKKRLNPQIISSIALFFTKSEHNMVNNEVKKQCYRKYTV